MKNKIKYIAPILLIAVIVIFASTTKSKPKTSAIDPCSIDLLITFINDAPNTMKEEEVARTFITRYLDESKKSTSCPTQGIKDYKITFVGDIKKVEKDFMARVKFDVIPLSMEKTTLATPGTTIDGEWIRNKEATLGIERTLNATTTSYRLVI